MSAKPYGQRGKIKMPGYRTGPDGKPLCRWCDKPVPKGRRTWCSRECVEEWRVRGDWNAIRRRIIERDKVCKMCGGNRGPERPITGRYGVVVRREMSWEVDHIVAVEEGGTDDPANLRLLCRPCHREVTARQRREKALRRRGQLSLLETT